MKEQIKAKIINSIKRYSSSKGDQVNLHSAAAQQDLAEIIVREILETDIGLETHNEDQLELFSFMDSEEHK